MSNETEKTPYEIDRDAQQAELEKNKLGPMEAKLRAVVKALSCKIEEPTGEERRWRDSVALRAKTQDGTATIHIGAFGYREPNRIRVGVWLAGPERGEMNHHGIETPSIGMNADKTVDEIVAEIRRRFLPDFAKAWALAQERNKASVAYFDKRQANIAELTGRKPKESEGRDGNIYLDLPGNTYGTARISSDSVHLDLSSLPVELAVKIVKLLRAEGKTKA